MVELLIATQNKGKLKEIREFLSDMDIKVTSLADYKGMPEIIEDGATFKSNAIKKARTIADHTKKLVMGEDSGIEIKPLNNRPGVFSARYSGPNATDKKNNSKLLRELRGLPLEKREARYRCFAALADGKGLIGVVSGSCKGLITHRLKGKNGFGYDPLFYIPRYQKTFGELPPEVKAQMSHRSKALKKLKNLLAEYLKKPL